MNRQKREQLIGTSQRRGGNEKNDRSEQPGGQQREQVKGNESRSQSQKETGMQRQPGRLPLPD